MSRTAKMNTLRLKLLQLNDDDLPCTSPPATPIAKTPTPIFRKGPNDARIYQPEGHPRQCVIDGEIWPPIFNPENVRTAKSMKPREDDLFICTYPKCGTTWLQHIVHQLVRQEKYEAGQGKEMCLQSPMIERMGAQYTDSIETPRILKTHFAMMNVPKSEKAKYIFCARNPKDCLVSYYHHNRNFKIYNWADGSFDAFFELFISGQLAFGDYFDHLLGWLPCLESPNVLFLTYEEMCEDLVTAVHRIGTFIGGHAAELVEDPEKLNAVVDASRLDSMKKDQGRWFPQNILHKTEFIRKGGSRDWKNYLTKEQSDRLDTVYRTRCADTAAEHWWRRELAWEDELPSVETEDLDSDASSGFCSLLDDDEDLSISRRNSIVIRPSSRAQLKLNLTQQNSNQLTHSPMCFLGAVAIIVAYFIAVIDGNIGSINGVWK
ncbi:unnamed protein product, partial [Mesorhabditis spiculigera]